ncbi:hypothetical protein KLP28_13360 [Nocardioidaceae bacterium]|nr:hypothetical protein KLP28_13360 [Nocardioidaceae bacterium]
MPEGSTPAEEVVRQAAAFTPRALARKPWRETSSSTGVSDIGLAFGCSPPDKPTAMVGRSRSWVASTGPLPTDVAGTVSVSVRAYGAGGGGLALAQLSGAVSSCASTYETSAPEVGVESFGFASSDLSTLVWRRGDVLVSMAFQQSGGPGSLDAVTPWANAYDKRLRALLATTCAAQRAPVNASVRSPHLEPGRYEGRRDFHVVRLDVPAGWETAEEMTTAPTIPIPGPDLGLPEQPYRPYPPAAPIFPASLPSEVVRPALPTAPEPAPEQAKAGEPVPDPVGPGCGWDFTGQAAPRFDAERAERIYLERRAEVQRSLRQQWRTWQEEQADYWEAYDAYESQAPAYLAYVEDASAVAAAWAEIQAERDAYASALAAREAAIEARKQFFIDQRRAQRRYDAAVVECRQQPPAPAPSPDQPGGNGNGQGNGGGNNGPSRGNQQPTQPTGPTCPPERPSILDEDPPTIPPEPTPPADPRP